MICRKIRISRYSSGGPSKHHAEDGCEEILAMAANADTWESKIFREVMGERLARRYAMAGGEENLLSAAKLLETRS